MKLEELYEIIKKRRAEKPQGSYVANLVTQGIDRAIQKVGEEAVEVVIAAKNADKKKVIEESSDLLFHLLILLEQFDIPLTDITDELGRRNK